MKANPLPPIEVLRERYRYEANTGTLYIRTTTYNKRLRQTVLCDGWRETTTRNRAGYLITNCMGVQIKAHRICWALYHGADPYPLQIDHINRDKSDNRICNLRAVSSAENCANRSANALYNTHSRTPTRITYPDGRGTIVCDSVSTAARILNRNPNGLAIKIKHAPNNEYELYYGSGTWAQPSGITVSYA